MLGELISVIKPQGEVLADGESKAPAHRGKIGRGVGSLGRVDARAAVIEKGEELQKIRATRCAEQIAQPETGRSQLIADQPPVIAAYQPLVVSAHSRMATQTEFLAGEQFAVGELSLRSDDPGKIIREARDPFGVQAGVQITGGSPRPQVIEITVGVVARQAARAVVSFDTGRGLSPLVRQQS